MGYAVRAYDEAPGQPRRSVPGLRVVSRQTTAGDLIRHWVAATLARQPPPPPIPTAPRHCHPDELALHPGRDARTRRAAPPDLAAARARALAAFARGRIVLLVDDRRIEGEATPIGLTDASTVTFLRLVPLAGG